MGEGSVTLKPAVRLGQQATMADRQICKITPIKVNKKQVRFADVTANVLHYLPNETELTAVERSSTWWTYNDFQSMASDASQWAEESRRNKSLIQSLDQALRETRRAAFQQNPRLESEEQRLRLWCQYGHSRRGLERLASPLHETPRSNIINMVRRKVVQLSRFGADEDELRTVSERGSTSSILFARIIGMADAQAALNPFPVSNRKRPARLMTGTCLSTPPLRV